MARSEHIQRISSYRQVLQAFGTARSKLISCVLTGSTVDVGVACTTETFAQLTTMTPNSASQIEEKHRHGNAGSKPNSKPSSPTPRNRATPVVEIFQSRPKSAESRKGNAARPTGNSSPTAMKPPIELSLTASDSESDAGRQTSSKYGKPSTLQVIDKSGSAGTSQPWSSKVGQDLSPTNESESSNSKTTWNLVPARQAAKSKKSYVDDYQADELSDEADLIVPQKKTRLPKATAKNATGSKGKGRAADADDFSNSETDEPTVASNLAEPYKATKSASATKTRNPASAIKAKRIMQRSKSEGNVLSKSKDRRKGKGRSSSSSESEDLFATMTASPSKKKRASGKTGSPAKRKATPSKPKASALAPPPLPDDSSDDDLPTLPFSSQPLPQGQSMQAFDLLDIDDIAFVAIPAKRKSVHEGETLLPNAQPHFWWPARVMNRNRKNFTVSPLVDEPTQEITQFW